MPSNDPIKFNYQSPRWSGEILDCSMPMTMDTYSACSYRCLYCLPANSTVLRADLRSVLRGDVAVGDALLGFARDAGGPRLRGVRASPRGYRIERGRARWVPALVTAVARRMSSLLRVVFESGRDLFCTPEHLWLLGSERRSSYSYRTAAVGRLALRVPLPVSFASVTEEGEEYKRGYVLGVFDGDGSLDVTARAARVGMTDEEAVLRYTAYLQRLGFRFGQHFRPSQNSAHRAMHFVNVCGRDQIGFFSGTPSGGRDFWRGWLAGMIDAEGNSPQFGARTNALVISQYREVNPDAYGRIADALRLFRFSFVEMPHGVRLLGGQWENARLAQLVRPAIPRKATGGLLGSTLCCVRDRIVAVEPAGVGEVVSLKTTTENYVAEGYASHNCFSFYQKSIGLATASYLSNTVRALNVNRVRKMFTEPDSSDFGGYIRSRRTFQWGGLADQFDEYERRFGITLSLLPFFRDLRYPISFSTKGTWWTEDERYMEIVRGMREWHFKVSIITLDAERARKIEVLVPSPQERLRAIARLAKAGVGGVTLRLRPFILGVSSRDFDELIHAAADAGADSVSTEFMCLETRNTKARARYAVISRLVGFDIYKMYRQAGGSGYLRLNRGLKRPWFDKIGESCERYGLKLHISDAHFKERGATGSCCGLKTNLPWSRQQFTEALLIAKQKGRVTFSEVYTDIGMFNFDWRTCSGFNTEGSEERAKFRDWTMADWIKFHWNSIDSPKSPAKYFGGILRPAHELDADGNVVYEYVKELE